MVTAAIRDVELGRTVVERVSDYSQCVAGNILADCALTFAVGLTRVLLVVPTSEGDQPGRIMLGTLRVARGLTQSQLARTAGVSQAILSKAESGLTQLDEAKLASLAQHLRAPVGLLTLPVSLVGAAPYVFHRKRSTLPISMVNQLRAELDLVHLQVAAIVGDRVPVRIGRIPLPEDGYLSPEEVADAVRSELGLSRPGPVANLVGELEAAGMAVLCRPLGSTKLDAMVSWPPGRRPVVLLGDHAPGDRQRFSVAHELGHAVMHDVPTEEQESEADRFASELLMPRAGIAGSLDNLTVPRLAKLKAEWGVSMAALVRRARDLGRLSDSQYRQMNIEFSRAGYRTREPVEVPIDSPSLVRSVVDRRLASGDSVQELAREALMNEDEFCKVYLDGGAS